MKTWFAVLLILCGLCTYAYGQTCVYQPPMLPGLEGSLTGPGGTWTYQPARVPGLYDRWTGPDGSQYEVEPPLLPGFGTTIRRSW